MCIARVGRILSINDKSARVGFFDGRVEDGIDIAMIEVKEGSFVEVFGKLALSKLSNAEARRRKSAWVELRRSVREIERG
ncbi:MAG: HypC/HybG/HupF family hydrogenase formation chaperone [Conexivisphaerales archaeon]